MWLRDYKPNLAAPLKFRKLSLVLITIEDTAIVEEESSPETAATSAGSGVYNLTFPKGQYGFPLGAPALVGVAGAAAAEVVAFDPTAGTMQIDTGSDLSGGDRCYVAFLIGRS